MEKPSDLFGGWGQGVNTDQLVNRLGARQMMTDWANTAESLHKDGYFPVRATLNEAFKTAKFDNMESCLLDPVVVVEKECDLTVPFNAGHRIDDDAAKAFGLSRRFWNAGHVGNPKVIRENPRLSQQIVGVMFVHCR